MNVDGEGKELEKCIKMIAGRTIKKVYGTAAIMIIPAELRQAIKERREGTYNDRRTLEDLGSITGTKEEAIENREKEGGEMVLED